MKTNTTPVEIKAITAALATLYKHPFSSQSCDPKYNAQRNLRGLTHYVDDDTLRFHHSRICSTSALHGGLLFRVTCSDALDMHNTKRGFRSAVFDLFGTTVSRPDLEHASKTSDKAIQVSNEQEIDLVKHYTQAIEEQKRQAQERVNEFQLAADAMPVSATMEAAV